jgi:hypothetical protein
LDAGNAAFDGLEFRLDCGRWQFVVDEDCTLDCELIFSEGICFISFCETDEIAERAGNNNSACGCQIGTELENLNLKSIKENSETVKSR